MLVALSASALWVYASLILGVLLLPLYRSTFFAQYEFFKLGRWAVLPYIAMLFGYISPRLMGLTNLDWATTFGIGLGICFGLLALTAVARVANNSDARFTGAPALRPSRWIWISLSACVLEFHWSFIRAGIWETLLELPSPPDAPIYTAVWIAGALATLEIFVHSRVGEEWLGTLVTLLFTSVLFLSTRNIYLCCLLHVGMAFLLSQFHSSSLNTGTARIDSQRQSLPQR